MLDKIIGSVLNNVLSSNNQQSHSMITDVLGSLLKNGGLDGILSQFQRSGTVSQQTVDSVAQQSGVDKADTHDILSQLLPNLINSVTHHSGGNQDNGFGLDDLIGGLLGRSSQAQNNMQASSQQDKGFGLDDLIGGLLGGQSGKQSGLGLDDVLGGLFGNKTQQTQVQSERQEVEIDETISQSENSNDLANNVGSVLNNFFK